MAVLSVWLLLLAGLGASSGDGLCPASDVTVFGAPGGPVLLRLEQSELAQCYGECQLRVTKDGVQCLHKGPVPAESKECRGLSPGCHVHPNGTLELTGATTDASGSYTLRLESGGVCKHEKHFRVHIQEPVSEPEVQLSCFAPGGIGLCCRMESGTKVSYSWSVNGMYYNSSASCMNLTIPQTELINATCTAWNLVSEHTSQPLIVTCPDVPVADGDAIFVLRLVSAAVILVAMGVLIRWHLM